MVFVQRTVAEGMNIYVSSHGGDLLRRQLLGMATKSCRFVQRRLTGSHQQIVAASYQPAL